MTTSWKMPPRNMDELWEAANGACRLRNNYWGLMGLYVHSGAGWQAVAWGADGLGESMRQVSGHGREPRIALAQFLIDFEQDWMKSQEPPPMALPRGWPMGGIFS